MSAYEQVAHQLRDLIVSGELPPGERLPTEEELASAFAVSRATVREALRMLSAQQLIRTTKGPGGGSQVTVPTTGYAARVLEATIGVLAHADDVTLDELLEARRTLEVAAVRLAAARRTDADLEELDATIRSGSLARTRDDQFAQNHAFHSAVLRSGGNRIIAIAGEPVFAVLHARLARSRLSREVQRGITAQHAQIAEAIAAGDADAAAREMEDHLEFLRPRYERVWRNAGARAGSRP